MTDLRIDEAIVAYMAAGTAIVELKISGLQKDVELLSEDVARLRRELDECNGVIR